MQNATLYLLTSLIWGSTWLAIKYQLGSVDPEISVAYRFALAAAILLVYSRLRGLPLRFSLRDHLYIGLQGLTLFSLNYILVYLAELYLTSGLVAIAFSLIIVFNVFLAALLLRNPILPRVLLGAVVGMAGLALVFRHELTGLAVSGERGLGLLLAVAGTAVASVGNIVAARNQRQALPIVQTNAIGMAYGALITLGVALLRGAKPGFEASFAYVASLLYLAAFGSVIAFGGYLTLLGRIGPDRAAYISLVFPIVALILSTLFEGLRWGPEAILGVLFVVAGNAIALTRRRRPVPVESLSSAS